MNLLRVPPLALLLALGACTAPAPQEADRTERVVMLGCNGVSYADVRGPEPGEPNGTLRDHPVADAVCEAWWLDLADEVRGSTMAAHDGQLVIAGYRPNGSGKARWYDEASVLARGVTGLVESSSSADQVAMTRSTRVPARLQGFAFTPGGVPWHASSRISCGLLRPGRRTLDFVPGAEDFEVTRDSIWLVSEASASPYRDPAGALVPRLLRLDRAAVLDSGRPTCEF